MTQPFNIDEAKRICGAATPGPWVVVDCFIENENENGRNGVGTLIVQEPDSEFILFARTALPAALEEIERLRAAIAKHNGQMGDGDAATRELYGRLSMQGARTNP